MFNLLKKSKLLIKNHENSEDKTLSLNKECTEQIKGLAILAVLIGHYCVLLNIKSSIIYLGSEGVAIFLILSGYGLTLSYNKTKNNNFFSKRFSKVFIPYFLVTLCWIIINTNFFHITYSLKTIFLSLIGFDIHRSIDGTMWYISFIMLWYFIFYFIFKFNIRNIFKLLFLFCFAFCFRKNIYYSVFHINFGDLAWQFSLHAYFFPIGVLVAFYFDKITQKLTPATLFVISIIFFLIYLFNVHNSNKSLTYFITSNFLFSVAIISFLCILSYFKIYSRVLKFLGQHSYEIYLLEGNLLAITHYFQNKLFALPCYLLVLFFFSILLSKIIKLNLSILKKSLPA